MSESSAPRGGGRGLEPPPIAADVRVEAPERVAAVAATAVAGVLAGAIEERGRARWVLAGGRTPAGLYAALAGQHRSTLDWSRVDLYWGDERAVPPGHAESNFRVARASLLDPLALEPRRIHRIRGELGAEAAARDYDERLAPVLDDASWDLVLLGVGADGHTASLFPPVGDEARSGAWAIRAAAPGGGWERVTLTLSALNRSRRVLFLATGAAKARAVAGVLAGDPALPAAWVRPEGGAVGWLLDTAAARLQSQSVREK